MTDTLDLAIGTQISCNDMDYTITGRVDMDTLLTRSLDGKIPKLFKVKDVLDNLRAKFNESEKQVVPFELVDDDAWENAVRKQDAVIRVFENGESREKVANELGIHTATLYDFRDKLYKYGFEHLIVNKPSGGAGKSRTLNNQESILIDVIGEIYLKRQKPSVAHVYRQVKNRCKAEGISSIGRSTVYRRCKAIDQQIKDKKRRGAKATRDKYAQTMEGYQEASRPLEIIQIDHTLMDIIIVDDETRQPIGRPWLTIAIDVYSRMVYGFYISLDDPSAMSTALCLQMAVFKKDAWLTEHGIDHSWDIYGLLEALHMDNGTDFHSVTLKRGCEKHRVHMIYRPVGKPEYGAHIERLIGTFMEYMKVLPGATFSDIDEKEDYDSEKYSIMTFSETVKWFATLVTGQYHKEKHSVLCMSPEKKFLEGLQGNAMCPGAGINRIVTNEDEFLMDFTPFFMKTVQNYGIQIDKVRYNCKELKRFLQDIDPKTGKKRKFLVRRDPRNISVVNFYDPESQIYITVPYKNQTRPILSLFELRRAQKRLKELGKLDQATEDELFRTHQELENIMKQAARETKRVRRDNQRRKLHRAATGKHKNNASNTVTEKQEPVEDLETRDDIRPFDEVEML